MITDNTRGIVRLLILIGVVMLLIVVFFPAGGCPSPWLLAEQRRRASARHLAFLLLTAIKDYQDEYGFLPKGSHQEVIRTLSGVNPKKLWFLDLPISAQGELVDPWGVPYRLGADEGGKPWTYSCGPDKRDDFGAEGSDDIVSWR